MGHDVLPAVGGENGLVGPRRSVERDLLLDQALVRRQLRVGVADHDKRRCRVREISAFASGLAHALFCPRKNTLAEIFRAVERVDVQTFADLPGHAAHVLVYARDVDWDPRMLDRPGIEHRCHEVEAVELAVEVELGAGLPAVPDGPDRQHLLAKLRARRLELHRETPLVMPLHLGPESEDHPSARGLLEIPRDVCGDHRAAREGDSDGGAKFDTLSSRGGDSERQIRIVLRLRRPQAVVAHGLDLPRVLRNGTQIMGEHAGVELHGTPCVLVCLGFAQKVELHNTCALSALFAAVYFTMTAMKNSKLRIGAAVTIKRLFLLISSIFIPASLLMAQSVADAAKTERERRERVKGQGRVFTDSDLKSISERSNVTTGTLGKGINTSPNQGIVAIPVRRVGSAMIVSAELNNRLKTNLVVDTGASYVAISKPVAASLGLKTTEHTRFIPLQTGNGMMMAPIMKLSSLRLGGIEVNDVEAAIIEDWSDSNVVGVLGMNFLSAFDWSTDNANGQLLLKRLVDVYGGHGKDWWIERFRALRTSIEGLKTQLKSAENLGDRNRISQTEDVLNRFQAEMDLLTRQADEAGLPIQYRN